MESSGFPKFRRAEGQGRPRWTEFTGPSTGEERGMDKEFRDLEKGTL